MTLEWLIWTGVKLLSGSVTFESNFWGVNKILGPFPGKVRFFVHGF